MSYVVIALLLLIVTSILAFVLKGNSKLIAKEMKEEIVTGTLGKVILGGFLGLLIVGVFIVIDIFTPEKTYDQPTQKPDYDAPGKCSYNDGVWKDGKCIYLNENGEPFDG